MKSLRRGLGQKPQRTPCEAIKAQAAEERSDNCGWCKEPAVRLYNPFQSQAALKLVFFFDRFAIGGRWDCRPKPYRGPVPGPFFASR